MRYQKLKDELKVLAKEIRYWKAHRKLPKRTEIGKSLWQIELEIKDRKFDFRHMHIAYCLLRGRTYEQIENHCGTSPEWSIIDSIKEAYNFEVGKTNYRTC